MLLFWCVDVGCVVGVGVFVMCFVVLVSGVDVALVVLLCSLFYCECLAFAFVVLLF